MWYISLPSKKKLIIWIALLAALIYGIGTTMSGCLSERQHRKRLKTLGEIGFHESAWKNPSQKLKVKADRYHLISYESRLSAFVGNPQSRDTISIRPYFEQLPNGTRNIMILLTASGYCKEICRFEFASGASREYKLTPYEQNRDIKKYVYSITMPPEEYYLYFINDVPSKITMELFGKYRMTKRCFSGREHEFACFREMKELFVLKNENPALKNRKIQNVILHIAAGSFFPFCFPSQNRKEKVVSAEPEIPASVERFFEKLPMPHHKISDFLNGFSTSETKKNFYEYFRDESPSVQRDVIRYAESIHADKTEINTLKLLHDISDPIESIP